MNESEILVTVNNNVQIIKLNRPKKKNAITLEMYKEITDLLNNAAVSENIIVTVLTGQGEFYSSGIDVTSFLNSVTDTSLLRKAKITIQTMVEAFINFPKILIGIMNGPAIGLSGSVLALCDVVYASDKAYLFMPFTNLALTPEGCSSYTFPKIFGSSMASEVILFGHKVTSQEAFKYGFVSKVYSSEEMLEEIWNKIYKVALLPRTSLFNTKKLLRDFDKDTLKEINIKECNELEERWKSEEALEAVTKSFTIASKL